ncbi:hypothetical protein PUR28_19810 [Streptomyces sp. BE308]|uniref:hypothetical protein n=1 Tax=Streptomyces sp. BE308 TaxID=3002529 RepID=UPI002E770605|nr:hypothetical protein [Streptomyces sp. BE308]MEE1792974.1 hypothetical protein [Streptomyces sp. BE308]
MAVDDPSGPSAASAGGRPCPAADGKPRCAPSPLLWLLSRRSSRVITVYGTSALAIGTVLSLAALAAHSFPAYLATVVIVGSGFGTSFMGALRTLMPYTVPAERAAIMGVIYSISYLALGVPTIVAGLLVPVLTVQGTMAVLGVAIAGLGVVATIARLRLRSDDPAREPAAARQP